MKIQFRLLLLTISMILVSVAAALLVSTYLTREALEKGATEKLSAVLAARHSALLRHLETIHREMHIVAASPSTVQHLAALSAAYAKLGRNAQTLLQQNYLATNGEPKKAKPSALLGSDYDNALSAAQPFFMRRHDTYGWGDVFLIDRQGNVVFSLLKEDDFATNLHSGPWKDSGLARAVTPLLHDAVPGVLSFADFTRYAPSRNRPAAFVAMPVFDREKQVFLGVVAIQLPVQQINQLMQDKTGLGESGETFLVGKDGWMLSDSRFRKESSILETQLKTQAVAKVLDGQSGLEQLLDYRGINVYVSFTPLQPFSADAALGDAAQWGVIAKIDKSEVLAEFYALRQILLLTGSGLALLAILAGILWARSITQPIFALRDALSKLSRGEAAEVPGLQRRDEIGEMAKAAEAFREMAQQVEHEHWVTENVNALTGAVSAETRIEPAADRVLHLLCEKLAAPVGAIYLLNGESAYQRVGAHGLARRSQAEDVFQLGAGLPGQCAKDNQALVLSPVPVGLAIISSGLAEFPPHELVLYPIAHKQHVLAVLELAVAQSLTPLQHEFVKAAAAELGLHLANLQASEHNLLLLGETRQKSAVLKEQQEELLKSNEEMRALSEELRSQAEEVKAQNEELKASQEELRAQQEEMKHKNQILEKQSEQLKEGVQEAENKARELQLANQYKSEFLANMSHELRTPLNSVLILSRNLAENDEHNLTPDQVESATVISESGTQLLTLINDILDLSKIEAGRLELLQETFPLDELLAYLRRIFSPQAEKKRLAFTLQVDPAVAETIHSDRQRLTQVLSNLLSNAIKFTDSGAVSVWVSKDRDHLQFEVIDSGIGIPADKLEHIFGEFQQVDGSTSRKYGGSGLGLAISRHLTGLLGGEIAVSSELGKGSRFTLRLLNQFGRADLVDRRVKKSSGPAVLTAAPGKAAALATKTGGSVLVVEDDARLLSILGRMIQTLGFTPVCVGSAEQALLSIRKETPAGMLLDLGLPHMDGIELLRHLKADKATERIPVFIMSRAADTGEAKVLGALGFLKKPVTRDTIAAAIKTMTGGGGNDRAASQHVLLVNDNPADIKFIGELLTKDGLEIRVAESGKEALQLLKSQQFDTVILELMLPDMSGFAWLKQAHAYLNPPPVVVYSAQTLTEAEIFELKEDVESIVSKGALNERLREEVLRALQLDDSSSKRRPPTAALSTGKRLLLVDDDARNLFSLTKVLRSKGYAVEVAPDGAKALAMLAEGAFDAVLTDIMMPEMDGYELIRQIRQLRPPGQAEMPIIAVTAKAMQGDDVLCMQAGASAYFAKPVDIDKLFDVLRGLRVNGAA